MSQVAQTNESGSRCPSQELPVVDNTPNQQETAKRYVPPHLRRKLEQEKKQLEEAAKRLTISTNGSSRGTPTPSPPETPNSGASGKFNSLADRFRFASRSAPTSPVPSWRDRGGSNRGVGAFGRRWEEQQEAEKLFGGAQQQIGINFDKYDEIPVTISGDNPPEPLATFQETQFGNPLDQNIKLANYTRPTPIQKHSIPIVLGGRDLMACAQTGSGKTAAFLFPIIARLCSSGAPLGSHGIIQTESYRRIVAPQALILAPTRELACQIFDEARKFSFRSNLEVSVVYGGTKIGEQMFTLRRRGCDLLVATPGRLHDMMERDLITVRNVHYLCLDEADRMLDMGFERQIREIVQNCGMPLPGERLTMMFSATFPPEIQRLAGEFLNNYLFCVVGRVGATTDDITQKLVYVGGEENRRQQLLDLLDENRAGLTLVFVETKRDADSLDSYLCQRGYRATSIHGDRTQREREDALGAFRSGVRNYLVATDVAARGLDIPNVRHVINYHMPHDIERYVHRIGRTGRVGNPGVATSFINESDKPVLAELEQTLSTAKQEIPDWFENLVRRCAWSRGGRGRGRGGYNSFGARDMRRSQSQNLATQTYTWRGDNHFNKSGGGGGGGGGWRGSSHSGSQHPQHYSPPPSSSHPQLSPAGPVRSMPIYSAPPSPDGQGKSGGRGAWASGGGHWDVPQRGQFSWADVDDDGW